jgi:hypothetical protein
MRAAQLLMKLENSAWFESAKSFPINSQLPATEYVYRWQPIGTEIRTVTRFTHPGNTDEVYGFYQCLADEPRHLYGGAAGSLPQTFKPAVMQRDLAPLIYIRYIINSFFASLGYRVESQFLDSYVGRGLALSFNPRTATYNQEYQEEVSMLATGTTTQLVTGPDGRQYRALKPAALTRAGNYEMSPDGLAFRGTKDSIHRMEATATDVNGKLQVCYVVYRNAAGQYFSTAERESSTGANAVNNMEDCKYGDGNDLIDAWWQTSQRLFFSGFASTQVWFSFLIPIDDNGVSVLGTLESFRIQVWPDFWPEYEVRLKPRFLLPQEWTMEKLLKGLTHSLGWDWETDNDLKIVRFDPMHGGEITWWNGSSQSIVLPRFRNEVPVDLTNDPMLSDVTMEYEDQKLQPKRILLGYESEQETWDVYNKGREVPTSMPGWRKISIRFLKHAFMLSTLTLLTLEMVFKCKCLCITKTHIQNL